MQCETWRADGRLCLSRICNTVVRGPNLNPAGN
jgi:hypothetical protein